MSKDEEAKQMEKALANLIVVLAATARRELDTYDFPKEERLLVLTGACLSLAVGAFHQAGRPLQDLFENARTLWAGVELVRAGKGRSQS